MPPAFPHLGVSLIRCDIICQRLTDFLGITIIHSANGARVGRVGCETEFLVCEIA